MDENTQKLLYTVLRKWKLVVAVTLLFTVAAFFYTAKLSTPTYTSTIKFLAYVQDEEKDKAVGDSEAAQAASHTSKMNYAKQMIPTYLSLIDTNEFYSAVAKSLNKNVGTNYDASMIKGSVKAASVEDTTVFTVTVTTSSAELSYNIASLYTKYVPKVISDSNNNLVSTNVVDKPIFPSSPNNLGYAKNCLIGFAVGFILSCAYIILRDMIDVRIKSTEELSETYDIPVLGTIPDFTTKKSGKMKGDGKNA